MSNEGYSRKIFDKNEEEINKVRELARLNPFSGRADPGDVISAKFSYGAGKQERERLISLAHDEALKENDARTSNPNEKILDNKEKTSLRIGDFQRIVLETESGNKYVVQKNPNGEGYLIVNFKTGIIDNVNAEQTITKGQQLFFGNGGRTSGIKAVQAYK